MMCIFNIWDVCQVYYEMSTFSCFQCVSELLLPSNKYGQFSSGFIWHTLSRLKLFWSFKDSTLVASSPGGKFMNLCPFCKIYGDPQSDARWKCLQNATPIRKYTTLCWQSSLVLRSAIETLNYCVWFIQSEVQAVCVSSEINKNCLPDNFQMKKLLWTSTCTPSLKALTLTSIGHVSHYCDCTSQLAECYIIPLLPTLPQVK
jgi:hypothetical protein